jgi:hypothetical protein
MSYQFKTTNIKGKEYVEVNQRVIAFRTLPQYKGFALSTELISLDPESCVVKATILDPDGNVLSSSSSFVPADDYFQKAVDALKNAKKEKRQSVFDSIMQHYGDKYTPEQVESLKKFL